MSYKPMFPKPDDSNTYKSKNLVLGDKEKFRKALAEIIEENREGLIVLGRS
jgi:hypothetical protein